jgi:glycerophosphoryl diester phosphodiesterase
MLDLKGRDPKLSAQLAGELARTDRAGRRLTVCSQSWALLEPLRGLPGVRVVHSVGSARQLAALRRRFAGRRLEGISIHRRLLDEDVVADLRRRADLLLSWPVAEPAVAHRLWGWGVDGVITESFEALAAELAPRAARPRDLERAA